MDGFAFLLGVIFLFVFDPFLFCFGLMFFVLFCFVSLFVVVVVVVVVFVVVFVCSRFFVVVFVVVLLSFLFVIFVGRFCLSFYF
jgi:hypothetical protein